MDSKLLYSNDDNLFDNYMYDIVGYMINWRLFSSYDLLVKYLLYFLSLRLSVV